MMKKSLSMITTILIVLLVSIPALAGRLPYNIGNIEQFLNDTTYFNGWESIDQKEFSGEWEYTAIGFESGHINITHESDAETNTTFSTADISNFGIFQSIDFDMDNLYFEDTDGPYNVGLNPYENSHYFQLYRLTEDSKALSYLNLGTPLYLKAGTIIIGFNDNGWLPDGDSDYDDIIIAMKPAAPVPEPATMILLGVGLVGLCGFRKRSK